MGFFHSALSELQAALSKLFKPSSKASATRKGNQAVEQSSPFPKTGNAELDRTMAIIDAMDGHEFEQFCAELLERCRYQNIHVTKSSGDQGVDIIAIKNGVRYAFQCKRYSSKLGNGPVQEVNTGKRIYSCQVGVVITNSYFTSGAEMAAKAVGVQLWDRETLIRKIGYKVPSRSPH